MIDRDSLCLIMSRRDLQDARSDSPVLRPSAETWVVDATRRTRSGDFEQLKEVGEEDTRVARRDRQARAHAKRRRSFKAERYVSFGR
jgi:hypothetical protein